MLAVDWTMVTLVVLIVLAFAGTAAVFVGRVIERDAAGPDHEINRARKRSANRFITVGALTTLACSLSAIVVALLVAMPIQR